jgi:signal transduction histidine kinase
MSLRASISGWNKSLYVGIALAMAVALLISFFAFNHLSDRSRKRTEIAIFDKFDEVQLQTATGALNQGGVPALKSYLDLLDRVFGGSHYLLDSKGVDVVSGDDRAYLLPVPPATQKRTDVDGRSLISHGSVGGKYVFAVDGEGPRLDPWAFLSYYAVAIIVMGGLCWLASVFIVAPIRKTANSIRKFGQGDLSVRIHSSRKDEIGQLGDSFDRMASQLEVLIVSERRLLEDISHELRSPLARLKFAVKLAKGNGAGNGKGNGDDALVRIDRDLDRLGSLVSDLLEITAVEGDPAHHNKTLVSSKAIAEEVAQDCALDATAGECKINLKAENGDVQIHGNAELLRRAVENVLRNAIRYSPPSSVVDLNFEKQNQRLIIAVRDRGPGVPAEMLGRIFDPFFRVEPARESLAGTGSGLGLSIAKRAVEAHGGTITAENTSPGLRISIALPIIGQ